MSTNIDVSNINNPNANWNDKVISVVEKLSLILLTVPFGSMALGIITEIFLGDRYFFLLPLSGFLFLPAGIFALLVQLFRINKKYPVSPFNGLIIAFSLIAIILGLLACMAIYVAVG